MIEDKAENIIAKYKHYFLNPVLDGELKYEGTPTPFKIRNLVKKDGSIDLSNPVFGDASKYLLITTDPEQFFKHVENSGRLVILIAPKFLIQQKIGNLCCTSFEGIMGDWKEDHAPFGFFYRMEGWSNSSWYDYQTTENLQSISKKNLENIIAISRPHVHGPGGDDYTFIDYYIKNFMFIFKKKLD